MLRRQFAGLVTWLTAGAVLASCGAGNPAPARPPVVLAAASLQEALTAAADDWARQGHPRPVISFAASSALARQVASGASADLFLSADEEWMDFLDARGLLRPGSRADLLTNALVMVAPKGSAAAPAIAPGFPLARALGASRLALADPDSVPAGKYARAALTSLGVWDAVAGKLARAENVRAAVKLVERGEAAFGVVYATDARAAPGLRVVGEFPASNHAAITYPVALMAASANPEAEGFRGYLLSEPGKAVFRHFGFGTM